MQANYQEESIYNGIADEGFFGLVEIKKYSNIFVCVLTLLSTVRLITYLIVIVPT